MGEASNSAMKIDKKLLTEACKKYELYTTFHLNDRLYLHFHGLRKIENLEDFGNLQALWLESNALEKIENLDHMQQLGSLFLQNNTINSISGLDALTNLHTLNLSNNCISHVANLSCCVNLRTLNLSGNELSTFASVVHVGEVPSLQNLDLQKNKLFEGDEPAPDPNAKALEPWDDRVPKDPRLKEKAYEILDLLAKLPELRTVYLKHNPIVGKMERYRKNAIGRLKQLCYLDDRPVSDNERLATNAWFEGGDEAEREEKLRQMKLKEDTYESNFAALRAKQEEARVKYAREKESKSVFAAAASAAQERGFGSTDQFNQEVCDRCTNAIGTFVPVPAWQAAYLREAPTNDAVTTTQQQPEDATCGGDCCEQAQSGSEESVAVKGIDELYEFANGIEGDDDEFVLPNWQGSGDSSTQSWSSKGMKDAVAHAEIQRNLPEPVVLTAVEKVSHVEIDEIDENKEDEDQCRFRNVADLDIEGEVNYVRIAREAFQGIQGTAAQLSTSLQEFNSRPNNARIKLQVVDDSESDSDDDGCADHRQNLQRTQVALGSNSNGAQDMQDMLRIVHWH